MQDKHQNIVNFPTIEQFTRRMKVIRLITKTFSPLIDFTLSIAQSQKVITLAESNKINLICRHYKRITQSGLPSPIATFNSYTRYDHIVHGLKYLCSMIIHESVDNVAELQFNGIPQFPHKSVEFYRDLTRALICADRTRLFWCIRWLVHDQYHRSFSHINPVSESDYASEKISRIKSWYDMYIPFVDGLNSGNTRVIGLDHLTYVMMDSFMASDNLVSFRPRIKNNCLYLDLCRFQEVYDSLSPLYFTLRSDALRNCLKTLSNEELFYLKENQALKLFPWIVDVPWGVCTGEIRIRKFALQIKEDKCQ